VWEIQSKDIRWTSKLVQIEAKRRGLSPPVNGKQVLAKGGFGIIYLVEINQTLAAMKVLDAVAAGEKEAQSEFEQELELLTRLRHPNILLYLGGSTANNDFFFPYRIDGNRSVRTNQKKRSTLRMELEWETYRT